MQIKHEMFSCATHHQSLLSHTAKQDEDLMKKTIKIVFNFILLIAWMSGALAHPLIIDTDVGTDDMVAMLYLLNHPPTEIKAITIASTGEAHCEAAHRNVTGLLQLTHQTTIPVTCGRNQPLAGNHRFPDWLRKSADSLAGAAKSLPKTKKSPSHDAVRLLTDTIQNSKTPIDILEIGPLTNLAELINQHPEIKNKIRMIYIMGGAINVPGNLKCTNPEIKNAKAEWNIYIDPVAADIVFRSGVPITLVPLDVTNQAPVSYSFYQKIKQSRHLSQLTRFLYELFHNDEIEIKNHQWYFWDALAAVITSHESLVDMQNKKIRVITTPEEQSGTTDVDNDNGNPMRICMILKDKKKFETLLLNTIQSRK